MAKVRAVGKAKAPQANDQGLSEKPFSVITV